MPVFKYTAIDMDNKSVKGQASVISADQLLQNLRSNQLMLLKYKIVEEEKKSTHKFKANEVADFSQELSTMLSAGISIIHALDIMLRRDIKDKIRQVYINVYNDISNGMTLSEALENQGNAFPTLFINMYRTGEESGTLDAVAGKMATHYTKEHRLNNKIKSATLYPKILLGLMLVVVIIIFTVILPQFLKLFEDIKLPLVTRIVIGLSNIIIHYWLFLIIGILSIILLVSYVKKMPRVRYSLDRMKLKVPKIGRLKKIIYTARFSRTLSSLYSSGLSMVKALNICSTTIGNSYIESQFPKAIDKVRNGEPLSSAIQEIDGFDIKLSLSILVGQESGQLDKMLDTVSDSFDYEAEQATTKLLTFLEPMLIIFMAVIVGFIALSVLLPIISLYQNIK